MHALTAPLSELAEIEEICEERGRKPGMLLLSGCVTSQKTHLMYALGKDYGHTLIVLSSEDKAKKIEDFSKQLASFGGDTKFDVLNGLEHGDACVKAFTNDRISWVLSHSKP